MLITGDAERGRGSRPRGSACSGRARRGRRRAAAPAGAPRPRACRRGLTGTWWYGMPKPSTSARWSGWLETTSAMSASSSPRRWRHSRSTQAVVLARDEDADALAAAPASVSRQRMSSRSATSCANALPSEARSPCSSVNSIRMKNSPPSGSVECWSEVMMFAPERARKPATAATMPWRSAQVMSRRPFTRTRRLPAEASAGPQAPWHFLNFLPEPHQHGSLRPIVSCSSTRRCCTGGGSSARTSEPSPP